MNCADNQDMIFDEHGMLFRTLIDEYSPEQMKIINSTLAISKNKTTKKMIKKLKSKKVCYAKVRAYKKSGSKKVYGAYSKVKKVRVK